MDRSVKFDVALRLELDDFYGRYIACLDAARYDEWPAFFTEECVYKVQPRENFERGLPLCTLAFESKGMLRDRVYGITQTLFHQPYYQRHVLSGLIVTDIESGVIRAEANYLVVRTKRHELSEVFNTGRYYDRVVREGDALKFAEKICVFDSELIPNAIIYPL
jgi:salicylate 5-hydroxylase small subunit